MGYMCHAHIQVLCFILSQPHILALSVFANAQFQRSQKPKELKFPYAQNTLI